MNEHRVQSCGCIVKVTACRCDFDPHQPHAVIVSACDCHSTMLGAVLLPGDELEQEDNDEIEE